MVGLLEELAAARGFTEMWLSVDPEENVRARRLYERLDYVACPDRPVWARWEFVDSSGVRHHGKGWDLTMRKVLAGI